MRRWIVIAAVIIVLGAIYLGFSVGGTSERAPGKTDQMPRRAVNVVPGGTTAPVEDRSPSPVVKTLPAKPSKALPIDKDEASLSGILAAWPKLLAKWNLVKLEQRDSKWAPESERLLKDEYFALLPNMGADVALDT